MGKSNNLLDFYNHCVKSADKKGYADLYKDATEQLMKQINEIFKDKLSWDSDFKALGIDEFHFEDINYGDGYFVFGRGSNTTNNFHIKELPGWLFGIWWQEPTKEKYKFGGEESSWLEVKGTLFWQWEKEINKFKPSYSSYCFEVLMRYGDWSQTDGQTDGIHEIVQNLVFMLKEPYLAFCRDYCGWNYNQEYHTRAQAKKIYNGYLVWRSNTDTYTKICNDMLYDFIKDELRDYIEKGKAFISESKNVSPECEVFMKETSTLKEGDYHFSELDSLLIDGFYKRYKAKIKECKSLARKHKVYWYSNFQDWLSVRNTRNFNLVKKYVDNGEW